MSWSRLRLFLALVLLVISLAALAWSYLPGERVIRHQLIEPTEMQLPTPSSFLPDGEYPGGVVFKPGVPDQFHGVSMIELSA